MPRKKFLYHQIYNGIKNDILNGTFLPGSKLPAEDDLCTKYQVSAITVKRAMSLLMEQGIIKRVPGQGTFVAKDAQLAVKSQNTDNGKPQTDFDTAFKLKKKIKLIGLVLEHVATPFGLDMMYQMDREADKAGYKLCIRFSYGIREKETEEIDLLLSMGVAGLIIMPCHGAHYNNAILKLIINHFPVVLIDKKMTGISVPSVSTDGRNAVKTLVRHLYSRGCGKIGLISVDVSGTTSLIDRREGFYSGMKELDLVHYEDCILPYGNMDFFENNAKAEYIDHISKYFDKMKGKLDGIVCTEFGIMPALVQAARLNGIMIGTDIKVCCIDEDNLAPEGFYFTHMKQDEQAIAKFTMDLLLHKSSLPAEDYLIPAIFQHGRTT
jgi:DNA-binding LacI/PurR family transcriptional regulator